MIASYTLVLFRFPLISPGVLPGIGLVDFVESMPLFEDETQIPELSKT